MKISGILRLAAGAVMLLSVASAPGAVPAKRISREEAMAAALNKARPEYPPIAAQLKLHGDVLLDAYIDETGAVEKVQTVSGNPVLARAAENALKKWKFAPFKENGNAVKAIGTILFSFK